MRIFIVEYITGGGSIRGELNAALLQEAEIMLEALIGDLLETTDARLLVSRDPRLPAPAADCEVYVAHSDEDIWAQWGACIEQCDAVWPVMPETGGLLNRISDMVLARGRRLVGSSPDAVAKTASKYQTLTLLQQCGIAVVPAYRTSGDIPCTPGPWVLKPDDGVGCEGIEVYGSDESMRLALQDRARHRDYVAQPYVEGESASLSMLCKDGAARLLAVNVQKVTHAHSGLRLESILVNGMPHARADYAGLAQAIAGAIPGLWGYVGVDFVVTDQGPTVLEVNPRLTVSYAGLYSALGINPAVLVMRMLRDGSLPERMYSGCVCVNIALEVSRVA